MTAGQLSKNLFHAVIALISFIVLARILPYGDKENLGLALTFTIAYLWVTEAYHISVTALLIPVLSIFSEIQSTGEALSSFADPIIFLFLGGFGIAAVLQAQKIDQLLAFQILKIAQGNIKRAIFLMFALTAFLSMWISNMATTALMLPLVMGLIKAQRPGFSAKAFAVLGVAHSATVGGLFTILGSPPNAIAAAQLQMNFLTWVQWVAPLALVLLIGTWIFLFHFFQPDIENYPILDQKPMEWTPPRLVTLLIFLTTSLAWIFSSPLSALFHVQTGMDSLIALSALIVIALLNLVTWEDIQKSTEWGVLILFGGGLALSQVLLKSGASSALTQSLSQSLAGVSPFILILCMTLFIVFLTELTSNTATAALLIPLFQPLAELFHIEQSAFVLMIAVAASCGFMLPVATPPNTLAYATNWISQKEMIRIGFRLNIFSIVTISLYFYFIIPLIR